MPASLFSSIRAVSLKKRWFLVCLFLGAVLPLQAATPVLSIEVKVTGLELMKVPKDVHGNRVLQGLEHSSHR